ncbi:MAG: cytochrome P450 [Ktedonobacteraceae bacterium]
MATQTVAKATKPIRFIRGERPLLGSLPEYQKDRLSLFKRIVAECGDVGAFHFGPFPLVLFNKPEHVHMIFVEHADDFDKGDQLHNAFRPLIGDGISTSEGEKHRRNRKLIAPPFQPRHVQSYADTMVQYGEQIQQTWKDGEQIDVSAEMTALTMSIVGKVLFDADVFTETDELGAAMGTSLSHVSHKLASLFPIPANWPTPRNKRAKEAAELITGRINKMIAARRANTANSEERNDFLSILLRARDEDGTGMDDEQIRAESLTLFGAGHETTATALAWAWYLLTHNPDIHKKVQDEVDSALQGRSPTYADLARLPYTLQVLKETMRLYPPAYAIARVALHDVEIDGYQFHKLGVAFVAPYTIHRRPDYYPDPERFDPERFTPENEKKLPRYAYVPFGAGPRICIGNHFAMMEGHLILATLAQRVNFELVPGQQPEPDPAHSLTIRPGGGIKVVVHRRDAINT